MGFFKHLFSSGSSEKINTSSQRPFNLNAMNLALNKCRNTQFRETLKLAIEFQTDLVEMTSHYCTCGECSKYQGRVFSVTGADSRFPLLPEQVYLYGGIHKGCRHSFYAHVYGQTLSSDGLDSVDPIAYSNRPLLDERSKDEIEQYSKMQLDIAFKKQAAREYRRLREKLPEIAPKSLSAYSRMKKAGTNTYIKIKETAKEHGIRLKEFK